MHLDVLTSIHMANMLTDERSSFGVDLCREYGRRLTNIKETDMTIDTILWWLWKIYRKCPQSKQT